MRRLLCALAVMAGAVGCTAFLLSASAGMRDVMVTNGGFCASGGPYVIAQHCSSGDMRLLLVGILAGLVCTAVYAVGTAGLGMSALTAGLLAWTALFGVLGWNFISLGQHPGPNQAAPGGWLVTGVVFWAMALGGLVLALCKLTGALRAAGRPTVATAAAQPLVRAVIPPALAGAGWQPDAIGGWPGSVAGLGASGTAGQGGGPSAPPGRAAAAASAVAWLIASLVGVAVGVAVSSSLIHLLK